ncbi:hypothetical protein BJ138DRAFT_1013642, partial [Hygrophoropsis aurantiaca]
MRIFNEHGDNQSCCKNSISVLRRVSSGIEKDENLTTDKAQADPKAQYSNNPPEVSKPVLRADFPPKPPTAALRKKIIRHFCEESSGRRLEETGCAVCGSLTRL